MTFCRESSSKTSTVPNVSVSALKTMAATRLCFCEKVLPQSPLNPSRRTEDNPLSSGRFSLFIGYFLRIFAVGFPFISFFRRVLMKSDMGMIASIALAFAVGLIGWAYRALKPPPPKICGSPDGPPITSPRIKLCNGRHLAYRESGVSKDEAKYKIIVIHGFGSSKDIDLPSPDIIEELKIYLLCFDRAGYGESDPCPSRSAKSEAYDIEELADKLDIGSKFYIIGISMGAYPVWSCLKYIPHRLLGASLVVPFVNYWWRCFPVDSSREALNKLPSEFKWTLRVAHYTPWLLHWWMTKKWLPSLSMGDLSVFSNQDLQILKSLSENPNAHETGKKIEQQGAHESLHRDLIAGYGKWEFDPLDLTDPLSGTEGSVHMWQGCEDRIIPYQLNRFLSKKLPWIQHHDILDGGHLLVFRSENFGAILRALILA